MIIAGIVTIVRTSTNSGAPPVRCVRSLDVFAERYARGEIEGDEFLRDTSEIARIRSDGPKRGPAERQLLRSDRPTLRARIHVSS